MRFLNKIVFINSAHIRYAEVAVDGNVHFIGTQGVGKTTVLRALLFFYNCRKDKLGIRTQGQQTFDNFYIPTHSSYIVYQVSRGDEEPPFSIILFRHNNRAAFRFVDAPYSRDWFVDELGIVASDFITVRQRLQRLGIDCSSIIERYTQYLDILYGNRSAHLPKDLLKYYLLKSQQYHNIPRIIQNVFLNDRVDAGFIKNIIINSIKVDDEEIAVPLNFFRAKLIHFNDELNDISLWTKKNRQGIVETRRDADKIIKTSHDIKAARVALYEQCGMLNYAMSKAERDIPVLKNKIEKKGQEIQRLDEKISKIRTDYEKDQQKIIGEIAVLAKNLKEASRLKKYYQEIRIDEKIERAESRSVIELELQHKERLLSQLIADYQSISTKYEAIRDRMGLDKEQYCQTLNENKNNIYRELLDGERERNNNKNKLKSEIEEIINTQISEIDAELKSRNDLLHEQELLRVKASASSPMKEELAVCEQNITDLERDSHQLAENKLKDENRLNDLKNKLEIECQKIEAETVALIKDLEVRIDQLTIQRNDEQRILDRAQGSLCEWLDSNVEGWEKSIGRIADEKNVLYSQNLSPRLMDGNNDTIFGISLDLENIEKEVRTPSMIRESISGIDKEIQSLAANIIQLREEKEQRIAETAKGMRYQMKSIQDGIDAASMKIQLCERQLKEARLRLNVIKAEERKHLEEIDVSFSEKIQELQLQIDNLTKERKTIEDKRRNQLRKIDKSAAEEEKATKVKYDEQSQAIDATIEKYLAEYKSRLMQLDKAEKDALSDSGVDTVMLESTKNEIAEIKASLDRIDKERDDIVRYRQDCTRLLDHVPQMQVNKKKLEEEETLLRQKFDERCEKYELKRREEEKLLLELRKSLEKASESKQKGEEFMTSNSCPPELKETAAIPTVLDCLSIISEIQNLNGEIYHNTNLLRECVNEFRRRFSANNTFKFPTLLVTESDYHNYADSLEDFVSNDKIKEFQQVTSNLYRDILSRAASDFSILLGRESEILRIIRDINYDFGNKSFAGVIRRIELRLDRSTMPIITQLQNITDFWNSHQWELGDINLFSSEERSDVNRESIKYLTSLSAALNNASDLKTLPLEMTFSLKFRITENDNTTDWVENIRAVGSEGTDILVKAIINILLISVFKKRAGQGANYHLHCMMDEIGRLADENIQGILNFANQRGIFIVNSSPKAHRPLSYRRLYMLTKDKEANTTVQPILSIRESEMQ